MAKARKHKHKPKSRKSQLKTKRLIKNNYRIYNKLMSFKRYGLFEITYIDNGFVQVKELLSPPYNNWYRELKQKELEKVIYENFPHPYFTTDSPMFYAIETGIININKPAGNAGQYPVKIKKLG